MATCTISNVDARLALADTAIGNQDYAAARDYVLQAEVLLRGIPDTRKDDVQIQIRVERAQDLIKTLDRLAGVAAGIQRSNVTYARAST